jgi:O-antigen ligase
MSFALRSSETPIRLVFLLAVGIFICVAWFGQSRTAFVSLAIALLALVGLMLKERRLLYTAGLATLAVVLVVVFPAVIEQAFLRGQGLRPQIWAVVWEEAKSAPFFGHGFVSQVSAEAGGHDFRTSHNAYLQVFWQAGGVGLLLFLTLMAVAFRYAWSWSRQQGDYSIFCMLLFATCTMITGVDTLIDRPRDQWMLFWFPLALLLSYQSGASRSRFHTAHTAPKQSTT